MPAKAHRLGVLLAAAASLSILGACRQPARQATPLSSTAVTRVGAEETPPSEPGTASPEVTAANLAQAYRILLTRLFLPVQPPILLNGAWLGAVAEARREGLSATPRAPAFGTDSDAALRSFQSAYAAL